MRNAWNRLATIALKEWRELIRDPVFLTMALLGPLALYVLMGSGMVLDVEDIQVAFHDMDRSRFSRDYRSMLRSSKYFTIVGQTDDRKMASRLLKSGRVSLVVSIPPDFSKNLQRRTDAPVQFFVDGMYPYRASMIRGYIRGLNVHFNRELDLQPQGVTGFVQSIEVRQTVWFNPTLESKNFILPGLVVTTLMFYPALLVALIVVREKETGTIFNLYTSPASAWEIVIGKIIPYIVIVFILFLLLFLISVNVYGVRFVGSFPLLAAGALLYIFCTLGIGMLISILTRSQLSAMLITFVATILPSFIYSGFMAPVASQGTGGQIVSQLVPATHFMIIVRGIFLKDIPSRDMVGNLFILFLFTLVYYGLSIWMFSKKKD
jgi:ABC-2 type transport system permease protein